jgi:hypothetical protein
MANQLSKSQYAWKQDGIMKRGWFPDKETCLKHCEQHKSDRPVYLYKQVLIPGGWLPFLNKYQSFRWQVKAHLAIRGPQEPDWTLLQGPWFQNPKNCLRHFKNMLREGYDMPDGCETTHYLVMRRLLRDHKRWLRHRERPLDI